MKQDALNTVNSTRKEGTVSHGIMEWRCDCSRLKNRSLMEGLGRVEDILHNSLGRWCIRRYAREESGEIFASGKGGQRQSEDVVREGFARESEKFGVV